ncbi:hypothetical protein PtA15_1A907 [Puccinia triticina]|uniref:Trafficking protein particle complex subunit 11 domain-containing protein n=1 Tax=Puccinia triticina TaxID=208348 RepID=A0ABY7C8S1_9BASI|nr:uncharacterized protein PtA15_1A907 [Puccinia triticina]WAQ81565.1 hypothetical protein PtA15_1A907 [Puccinia triticina]
MFFAGIEPSKPTPAEDNPPPSKDPFEGLIEHLRAVLAPKRAHPSIWIPRKSPQPTPEYRVLLVPKSISFPPRKTRPSSTSTNAVAHSPLSPLSQSSPLFPDGIITPIWIRKHRDMIPSVFVLTLRLWEPAQHQSPHPTEHEKFDHQLIYEISERKKTTSERGIKLAVIILTSRYMLDNPQLDTRLSYIRKKSTLDTRASLFVLSPVPAHDLVNFVHTLKAELYESTIDYYREHSRRVRRKRSRSTSNAFAQSTSYHQPGQPVLTPLSPQGWSVRSDYKLATFAEFRQEYELAIKSYEDCWEGLLQMFNSTAVLPPRTKRWAEAKVLIDCISFKASSALFHPARLPNTHLVFSSLPSLSPQISKLYLYSNEPTRAMYQFNKHIAKFRELCNGWGIGDETYEFWAWLSKQYTVLADLVDIGCRNGMRLPNLCPPLMAPSDKTRTSSPVLSDSRLLAGGAINLTGVLVHPGFYYFYAAQCAVERRNKFQASEAAEEEMRAIAQAKDESNSFQASPALAHERKINHGELIISLYTKAYEIFKTVGASRMTLFLALKIAHVHYHQNDHPTACKFFERIVPSYRKAGFTSLLDTLLYLSFRNLSALTAKTTTTTATTESAASEAGPASKEAVELFKVTLELLANENLQASPTGSSGADLRTSLAGLLEPLSQSPTVETDVTTLTIEPSAFPVRSQVKFWEPSIALGETVEFQVLVNIPQGFADSRPTMARLSLKFTAMPVLTINHHAGQAGPNQGSQTLDIGTLSGDDDEALSSQTLDLHVADKSYWLITGRLRPTVVAKIALEQLVFRFDNILNGRRFDLVVAPDPAADLAHPARWIERIDSASQQPVFLNTESFESMCKVQHKKPELSFSLEAEPCGIIHKAHDLRVVIGNLEQEALHLKLLVKLQSPSTNDTLEMDGETHRIASLLTLKLGPIKPSETLQKRLSFVPTEVVGRRVVELSLAIKAAVDDRHISQNKDEAQDKEGDNDDDDDEDDDQKLDSLRVFKITREAALEIEDPVRLQYTVQHFHQPYHPQRPSYFTASKIRHRCVLNLVISNTSSQTDQAFLALLDSIRVQSVALSLQTASCPVRMISCSLPDYHSSELDIGMETGNSFAISYVLEVEVDPVQEKVTGCFVEVRWACPSPDGAQDTHSKQIPLEIDRPTLAPIAVLTDLKPHLKLMEPVEVNYMIENRDPTRTADLVVKLSEPPTSSKGGSEWMISGPKLINSVLVLPRSSKVISLVCIPTQLGQISGPKVEVFQRINARNLVMMSSSETLSRLSGAQVHQPSVSSLKDLQELDSSYDGPDPPTPASQSASKLVPVEIVRSHTLAEKLPSVGDPTRPDDQLKSQNRSSKIPDRSLKVLVLPA